MSDVPSEGQTTRTGIIVVSAALLATGAVMAASAAASLDHPLLGEGIWRSAFGRQMLFIVAAFGVLVACSRIDPGILRWRNDGRFPIRGFQPSVWLLLLTIVLLLMVWVPGIGVESHGRSRWIQLGLGHAGLSFQPSELAKLSLVVFLAAFLSRGVAGWSSAGGMPSRDPPRSPLGKEGLKGVARKHVGTTTFSHDSLHGERMPSGRFIVPLIAIGVVCALVGSEDFGTAVLLAAVGGLMLIVGGCRLSTIAAWAIPTIGAFMYLLLSEPYRLKRLLAFRDIWDDPQGRGYHAIQSLAAIASGGWTGKGLGAGLAKYGYLPEARSDFIFALICEEAGFVGGTMVILLFIVLVYFGLRAMRSTGSTDGGFYALFAFGVTAMVGLQAVMNIAVVTVVAPTKGIALPLVSSGGSGVLCFAVAIGLLAGGVGRSITPPSPEHKRRERRHAPVRAASLATAEAT